MYGTIKNGKMHLNKNGKIVHDEWIKTMEIRSNIELDTFVIMPNHMHGIIIINDCISPSQNPRKGESHSPNNSNECNSSILKDVSHTSLHSPSNTIGAIVCGYKSAVTKQIHTLQNNNIIWQRNYYEHIIRNQESYHNISNYIINNPAKWVDDGFYCF
jgi:REP element-mobilizing transposase RayT